MRSPKKSPCSILLWLAIAGLVFALPASAEVTFDWVTVGDPGNACDTQPQGCFGSVAAPYRISKFPTTNGQYAEFLNAVAATDTNALYNTDMGTVPNAFGGISRSGSSGSFTYSAIAGRANMPVNFTSFWDSLRFVNWIHNGQPIGVQDNTTTEDGAYTFTPAGVAGNTIARNTGVASVFIPSEGEWYKAAYFNGVGYYAYPANSNT